MPATISANGLDRICASATYVAGTQGQHAIPPLTRELAGLAPAPVTAMGPMPQTLEAAALRLSPKRSREIPIRVRHRSQRAGHLSERHAGAPGVRLPPRHMGHRGDPLAATARPGAATGGHSTPRRPDAPLSVSPAPPVAQRPPRGQRRSGGGAGGIPLPRRRTILGHPVPVLDRAQKRPRRSGARWSSHEGRLRDNPGPRSPACLSALRSAP